jgi:hypothetical protein
VSTAVYDAQLIQIVSGAKPQTIAQVRDLMQRIDGLLPGGDGLKWFNRLYMLVTQQVGDQPPSGGWQAPAWLARLDVVFAQLYFSAIADFLTHGAVCRSWTALFEARSCQGPERIQFALAGMNAHINHDLALALLQTDEDLQVMPGKASAEHADFEHVNALLDAALPLALEFLATGLLGEIAQDSGRIGRCLAIWNVTAARDLAWDFADHLRDLRAPARSVALASQDQLTGVIGRSLLVVV